MDVFAHPGASKDMRSLVALVKGSLSGGECGALSKIISSSSRRNELGLNCEA